MSDQFRAGKRLWNLADDAAMRRLFPDVPTAVLATQLRRTTHAIEARASILGLKKSAAYLASPAACRLRRGNGPDHPGYRTQFRKSHVPANKGLHRPGYSVGRGRMQETQFKKGVLNGVAALRFRPIGSTRLVDGYLYRKISAVPGPWTANWKPEHILRWTRKRGPVPPSYVLVFKNGDHFDMRLSNLACIHRRALMARNSIHNLPKPLADTIQLLGQLKRRIRERTDREEQDRRSA